MQIEIRKADVTRLDVDAIVCMANCYSSRGGKLVQASAVSLPTEVVQCGLQFGITSGYISRRITAQ